MTLGGIRATNPSKRTAADLSLRPRGHSDRHGVRLEIPEKTFVYYRQKYVQLTECINDDMS